MQTITTPDTIPASKVQAFLADLGFDLKDVRELVIGIDGVHAELVAKDADGRPYLSGDEIAVHHIALRLDLDA